MSLVGESREDPSKGGAAPACLVEGQQGELPPGRDDGGEITRLLLAWQGGNTGARGRLVSALYPELRRLAGFHLDRQPGAHTLQATELLHEAYFRLVEQRRVSWRSRAHFMAITSRLMRRVLLDRARCRLREKRGGGALLVSLEGLGLRAAEERVDSLVLERVLGELEALDSQAAKVVEMRFFAGLSYDEIALALGLGRATVSRRWRFARSWLHRRLAKE